MGDEQPKIEFRAGFEKLIKDREGEVKITFTVPLSDEGIARQIPIQTELKVIIEPQIEGEGIKIEG